MDNTEVGLFGAGSIWTGRLSATLQSPRHRKLVELLKEGRLRAGLTQQELAKSLKRHQPFIVNIESGQRRIDVVEFLDLADLLGLDPARVLEELRRIPAGRNSSARRRERV